MTSAYSLELPARRRGDHAVEIVLDDGEYRWRVSRYFSLTGREHALAESRAFRGYAECFRELYAVTGWVPDGVNLMAHWDDAAPGLQATTCSPSVDDTQPISLPPLRRDPDDNG